MATDDLARESLQAVLPATNDSMVFRHEGIVLEIPCSLVGDAPRLCLIEGWYEIDELSQVLAVLQPGDVVLELGAGLGFISAKVAQHPAVERVVAVEADPRLVAVARRTYRLNRVDVELVHAVVAPEDGEATFYVTRDFWASSTVPTVDATMQRLPARSLQSLLEAVRPSVLFVDIEGAEANIFDGEALSHLRHIIVEVHPEVTGWHGVAATFGALTEAGFSWSCSKNNIATFTRAQGNANTWQSATEKEEFELLARSPYFDSSWYLATYPDVARANYNPILHYLRHGAGEGRNPSGMFDTMWYRTGNPEVAASGVNPLVHFLRTGASRGSVPHPIVILKSKIERTSEETANLLRAFSGQISERPGATSHDNWVQNKGKWAAYFMSEGIAALDAGDHVTALDRLKRASQVCPEAREPWMLSSYVFRLNNARALDVFEKTFDGAELMVAHVSCRKHLERARLSSNSFRDPSGRVRDLIVIGKEDTGDKYQFDPDERILYVPAADTYECLPPKVSRCFRFIGFSSLATPVLKVDDDIHCDDMSSLHRDLDAIIAASDYGGSVIMPTQWSRECRFWHFGKCSTASENVRPDVLFFASPYADGPYYWLSSVAVNLLSKASVIHERYFEMETFEDRAVGNVLAYYGTRPAPGLLTITGSLKVVGHE